MTDQHPCKLSTEHIGRLKLNLAVISTNPDYISPEIQTAAGDVVAPLLRVHHGIGRRLVAAWNACEGIPTDDLEACPPSGLLHIVEFANAVTNDRDAMLDALTDAIELIAVLMPGGGATLDKCVAARDKATGGAA